MKTLQFAVADRALKCLSKMCHTVIATDFGFNKGSFMYEKGIKNEGKLEEVKPKAVEESVGSEIRKMMGWEKGEGLEGSSICIFEPLKAKDYSREGMGSKAIDCDNITREEATAMIENYVTSNSVGELTFSSELSIDERSEIKMLSKRYNLSERTVMENSGRNKTLLVLSKKIGPEAIIEELEKEGRLGTHQLVRPQGGDSYVISKFLTYQDKRSSQGAPPQVLNQQRPFGRGGRAPFRRGGGFSTRGLQSVGSMGVGSKVPEKKTGLVTRDLALVGKRVRELLMGRHHGLYVARLEKIYEKNFSENLPDDWTLDLKSAGDIDIVEEEGGCRSGYLSYCKAELLVY